MYDLDGHGLSGDRLNLQPVRVQEDIVVGQPLPKRVTVHRIEGNPRLASYRYAYANNTYYLVDESGRVRPLARKSAGRAPVNRVLAFHVCDWLVPTTDLLEDRGMMGDGVIDLPRLRGWVEATGFAGYSEVEIFSKANWWQREGGEVLDTCIERHRRCV